METHRIDYSAFQRAELSEFLKKGLQTTREDPELIAFLEGAFYSEEKQADNERKPEQDIDLVKGMRRSAKEGDEQQSELAGLRSIGSIDFQLQESLDGWLGSPDTKPHEGRRKGGPGTEQDGDLELQMMQDILALNELDTHPSHAEQQSVAVISTPELGARAATSQCVDGTNATKLCLNISAICKASKAAKKSNRSKIATSNKIAKRDKSLKTIFAQDPAAKRAYAAEATRKYREKRKLEKDWLITRNRWLEEEQGMFQKRIGSLKGEISRLEGVMKGQNQDEYAWMLLEHQVLQREAKRQRTLLQTIKNVISYSHASVFSNTGVPWKCCLDEDSTEEYCGQKQKKTDAMVSLPELGVQSAVSNILGVCYLSVENAKKTWFDINLTANPIFKTALKQSHYFSELERVTTTGELLPKGCSVKTATKESVRLDFHGLWLSKETLTTALEKFISRKDEFSFFNFVKEYYQKRSGVKCRFTELNSMLSKLCLVSSDCGLETCERDAGAVEEEARSQGGPLKADNQSWQHGASDKKVIINRVKAEESFSGDGDAKETFWVTSLGAASIARTHDCSIFTCSILCSTSRISRVDRRGVGRWLGCMSRWRCRTWIWRPVLRTWTVHMGQSNSRI